MSDAVFESRLTGLRKIHQGKVRDLYEIDAHHMLIVATDRLSAFDVILPDPIPGKGKMLTEISNFWFAKTAHLVRNHLVDWPISGLTHDPAEQAMLEGRSVVVRRLKALPIEAVVRGYLIGSGWKDYQRSGEICGIRLPAGLRMADRLPEPIFTPATKAAVGEHDENISFGDIAGLVGQDIAEQVRDLSLKVYAFAAAYALERGIIIADTKFEFGLDEAGNVVLMDEVLTPDSSRFWPVATYAPGTSPPSFDKQFVRDYLETLDWNKKAPGPRVPAEVIARTAAKYAEAVRLLTA
ncbi:MAG: phosphoribosylaminoimidazolesuccinocarboxamide synthase [Gammaproteobacteria bacterium]|nr:phosphoribosylaminoimidazolesuccinocarboxamide synthase [Gammaproteobacteria bacterium]